MTLSPGAAPRVLVVEDDPLSRDMLSRRLRRKGFDVVTAIDGAEAVRVALDAQPDVILMDLSMPGVDGWEAMRWLRGSEECGHIPVIALTAHELGGMRGAVRSAGFADFEPKPLDLPRLLEKLRGRIRRTG